jgi:hypothetical protein
LGGQVSWNVQVTGRCSGVAQGTFAIPNRADDHVAGLRIWNSNGKLVYSDGPRPRPVDLPWYTVRWPRQPPGQLCSRRS